MSYDTFIGEVQNRAQLSSREEALRVTRITLETLSQRIELGGAENLAAQLPEEVGRHLEKIDNVEAFDWEEFVERIIEAGEYNSEEEGSAVHHARVVDDAVTTGALEDVRAELPEDDDWNELFELADQAEKPVDDEQRPE